MNKNIIPFSLLLQLSCSAQAPEMTKYIIIDLDQQKATPEERPEPEEFSSTAGSKVAFVTSYLRNYIAHKHLEVSGKNNDAANTFLQQTYLDEEKVLGVIYAKGVFCFSNLDEGKELHTKANEILELNYQLGTDQGSMIRITDAFPFGSADIVYAIIDSNEGHHKASPYYIATKSVQNLYDIMIDCLAHEFKKNQSPPQDFGLSGHQKLNQKDLTRLTEAFEKAVRDLEQQKPLPMRDEYLPCK